MRLGAQPLLWKWVLFAWEWKMISISRAEHLPSFWNRGPGELGMTLGSVVRNMDSAIQGITQLVSLIRIHWMVIYAFDNTIRRLNNPDQGIFSWVWQWLNKKLLGNMFALKERARGKQTHENRAVSTDGWISEIRWSSVSFGCLQLTLVKYCWFIFDFLTFLC